ncbi:amidohydrolase family protein [Nocardia takedensis]|uniref:amidohydrolase family protein n=1 Tax=Nocardia takedensis TaxID=259390 RepID=UPI0003176E05|nr:amidohydrolase family protein [Nocardia takedensis]
MSTASGTPWHTAIDVHHHILPDYYLSALAELGVPSLLPNVDRPTWTVESSLAMMDRQGIRAAVVSVWPGVPDLPAAEAGRFARRINRWFAEFVAQHDDRFGAFAILPFPHVDEVLTEFEYAIDVLGLDGVGLITNYRGLYVADRVLDPFHAEAARRGTPLFVHPTAPACTGQPNFGLPISLYEFPFETVRLGAQLIYEKTLERHPGLRMILSHGGGGLAYYAGRLTYGPLINAALADRIDDDPIGSLRGLYYDVAMGGDEFALASFRKFADPARILVGTDFPLMPESFSAENGKALLALGGFDDADTAMLNYANAEKLFPRFGSIGE